MGAISDILVVPFFGQGHLNPCVELCKRLSSCSSKSKVVLIIPNHLSSSIPSNLHKDNPSIEVLEVTISYPDSQPPPKKPDLMECDDVHSNGPNPEHFSGNQKMAQDIRNFINERYKGQNRPSCAVVDLMMSWSKKVFLGENIPVVAFFTCGAASTAIEHAAWKIKAHEMKPGETRMLDGLPDCLALRYSEAKLHHGGPPRGPGNHGPDFGLRDPGQKPRWLDDKDDSTALLVNTCHDLEGPFLDYISHQAGKPVFGVGPLLPDKYWNTIGSVFHDQASRSNRKSNYTEDEITEWLDSKPRQSVIYIAFGSEVGPNMEEYGQLAEALGDSKCSFIWVIQPGSGKKGPPSMLFGEKASSGEKDEGFYPEGLEEKVGDRGIIIKGWAPQLMILSHPSTGGFLSHCGWNSAAEAIGRGIPILAWPIRGDQFYNAKLIVDYLKTGVMVSCDNHLTDVKKGDIMEGIDKLMDHKEFHERAMKVAGKFENGFPACSMASIKELIELLSNK